MKKSLPFRRLGVPVVRDLELYVITNHQLEASPFSSGVVAGSTAMDDCEESDDEAISCGGETDVFTRGVPLASFGDRHVLPPRTLNELRGFIVRYMVALRRLLGLSMTLAEHFLILQN